MHDMVTVARDKNGIPMITFLCKSKDRVEINGKSFYSSDLIQIIEEYESDRKVFFRLIQGEKIRENFASMQSLTAMWMLQILKTISVKN